MKNQSILLAGWDVCDIESFEDEIQELSRIQRVHIMPYSKHKKLCSLDNSINVLESIYECEQKSIHHVFYHPKLVQNHNDLN